MPLIVKYFIKNITKINIEKNYIKVIIFSWRNTKIEIRPILSYGGSFPSHPDRTVKLRVRISSVTNTAALYCG